MPKEKKPRHFTCAKCLRPRNKFWGNKSSAPASQTITFPTSTELDKHLQTQHRSRTYKCTARGCLGKGGSLRQFQRSVGLTDHIKQSHRADTIFSCPVGSCKFTPDVLDVVAVHVHWAHSYRPHEPSGRSTLMRSCDEARGFINAAAWMYFRCPVWNCCKILSTRYSESAAHLGKHSAFELGNVQDKLSNVGYEVALATDTTTSDATCRICIWIRCPVCEARCEDEECFRRHIQGKHMFSQSPGTLEHSETWRSDVLSWTAQHLANRTARSLCWLTMATYYTPRGSRECSYPGCSFRATSRRDEHPSFLSSIENVTMVLFPHRMRILRHWPDFLGQPMFQQPVRQA